MLNIDSALGIYPQALKLRAKRAEILANNIANADTPYFKAKDIDFEGLLQRYQKNDFNGKLMVTNKNHIADQQLVGKTDIKYRQPLQPSLDGNTVDSQTEIAAFSENALRYQASLTFLLGTTSSIMSALKGE